MNSTGSDQPIGLECPGCGSPPDLVISAAQAFCGNNQCRILFWDPGKSIAELAASMKVINLEF